MQSSHPRLTSNCSCNSDVLAFRKLENIRGRESQSLPIEPSIVPEARAQTIANRDIGGSRENRQVILATWDGRASPGFILVCPVKLLPPEVQGSPKTSEVQDSQPSKILGRQIVLQFTRDMPPAASGLARQRKFLRSLSTCLMAQLSSLKVK